MGIMDRLMQYKFPIMGATSFAIALLSVTVMGPNLSTLINFFCPLLLSTGFFLAAIAVLLKISPPPPLEMMGDRTGEELMDYVVAGQQLQEWMILLPEEESDEKEEKGEGKPELESAEQALKFAAK